MNNVKHCTIRVYTVQIEYINPYIDFKAKKNVEVWSIPRHFYALNLNYKAKFILLDTCHHILHLPRRAIF